MMLVDLPTVLDTVARLARRIRASPQRILRAPARLTRRQRHVRVADNPSAETLRERIRGLCAASAPQISVEVSKGGACAMCHAKISPGEREYDLVYAGLAVRIDTRCFVIWEEASQRR